MRGRALGFVPSPVLVEQLRLVLANAPISLVASALLSFVLVLVLKESHAVLLAWTVVVWLWAWMGLHCAARFLHSPDPLADSVRVAWQTTGLYCGYGALWGALPWLILNPPTPLAASLTICMLAGIAAGGMTFMAPVLPVLIGFVTLVAMPTALKMLLLGGPVYTPLALLSVLYWFTLLVQARRAAWAYRAMIELRFENVDLVHQLRIETRGAHAARSEAELARVQEAQARGEAESANRAKSVFLAAASHDLRQPAHAQGMFLEVLSHGQLNDKQREMLANARAAGLALSNMLDTLLDFSRIEAGVINPQVRPFLLQPLLHQIEVEHAPQADYKGLIYRTRETHAVVMSDPALVILIVRNLVSNAIRYTERGGVLVGCRRRAETVCIEVWDSGIGIAPENQAAVFKEFTQLGNPERDRRKGLGLGLAIAQGLAKTLGCPLSLASTLGRGSVFRITLPLSHATPREDAPILREHPSSLVGLHILVIDDDPTVRTSMRTILGNWGAWCVTAQSIEDALTATQLQRPDMVISDYRLREQRTGAEAINAVRAATDAALPALIITGDTAPERMREAHASGVELLHKPVEPDNLYAAIVQILGKRSCATPVFKQK